ncbi:MAG: DEAD/DEAH box helicase family protein [Clostridia bacterium]|nr:DEAD/DEAH box helicase family protein [Clostridia bacterium]
MNEKIYEYRYMDESIKKLRNDILKNYLINNEIKEDEMKFVDLNIYTEADNFSEKVRRVIFKSKIDPNISLSKYQIEILNILTDNNLFLSAPTSFGKTFLMLEYIKRNEATLKNIIFIVPTLALMNELLRKIYNMFGEEYNICINNNEEIKEKNIFIFVPERSDLNFIKSLKDISIDFLVFDEIYKLQKSSRRGGGDDRIIPMNKAYVDLVKKANKFALLGPYINNVEFNNTKLDVVKFYTNYMPVYNEIVFIDNDKSWTDYINDESKLIYFKSPKSIYQNINMLLEKIEPSDIYKEMYSEEIKFLESNIRKRVVCCRFVKERHWNTPWENSDVFKKIF